MEERRGRGRGGEGRGGEGRRMEIENFLLRVGIHYELVLLY